MKRRTLVGMLLVVLAAACYASIVVVRQGPPSGGDTVPLTAVTTDIAAGRLHAAAANEALPDPPGYALLAAPFVAALGVVASPSWCTTPGRAADLHKQPHYRHDPTFATDVAQCGAPGQSLPPWYRSQGLLGVASWLVLVAGSLALLRAARADTTARIVGLLAFLAFLPAASSAIVQLFHPQDIVSLGLALGGMAAVVRRRFVVAGVLFGAALVTKQFAILLLLPAVVAARDARARLTLVGVTVAVVASAMLPFFFAAPAATLDNVSGFSAGGAVSGQTVLTLLGVTGHVGSAVARDAPVVFALGLCVWAATRDGPWLSRPETLVALGLACTGSRLVFESVVFPYYLLAPSVLYFLLDLVARRSPHLSLAWCAGSAFFVAVHPGTEAVNALGTLFFAVLAVAAGLVEVARRRAAPSDAPAVPSALVSRTT
ncbi:MAG TPA: glycosyltransferase 87 family protein [Acidimicrobiales bacterium]|nr:glycosyltransferase 87 family protein [Acidimicrobiales bacterium]